MTTPNLVYEMAWSCEHCGRSGVVRLSLDVTSPKERWEACVEAHKSYCRYRPYVGPASVRSTRYDPR